MADKCAFEHAFSPKTSSVQHALRAYHYVMWQGVKKIKTVNKSTRFFYGLQSILSHNLSKTRALVGVFSFSNLPMGAG